MKFFFNIQKYMAIFFKLIRFNNLIELKELKAIIQYQEHVSSVLIINKQERKFHFLLMKTPAVY